MKLPPKGDPRRALALACSSMRVIGVLMLLIAALVLIPIALAGSRSTRGVSFPMVIMVIAVGMYGLPGIVTLLLPIWMKQHQMWAVIVALVIASFIALSDLLGIASTLLGAVASSRSRSMVPIYGIAGIEVLILLALIQLIYHLAVSFQAIKMPIWSRDQTRSGFEPIMVRPLE